MMKKIIVVNKRHLRLIDENWLVGAITMPSNIFATTGTNVALIFIDKAKTNEDIFLMDAAGLGHKEKIDDNQRTVLSDTETKLIIESFKNKIEKEDFSIFVKKNDVIKRNYSIYAGQYFPVKVEYAKYTIKEFDELIANHKKKIGDLSFQGRKLEERISKKLEDLQYEQRKI